MSDTDTYDAATVTIMRQALGNPPFDAAGPLSSLEAGHRLREAERLRRLRKGLRAAVFHNAPVVGLNEADLVAGIAAPPEKETDR